MQAQKEKNEKIDWEQRRFEIAKDCLSSLCALNLTPHIAVNTAIQSADLLIERLRKKRHTSKSVDKIHDKRGYDKDGGE